MRALLTALFIAAAVAACTPGPIVQTGAPASGGAPAVAASSGTDCLTGDTCDFDCPEGNCSFSCATNSACQASCTGGNCQMSCATDASCDMSCAGGNCQFMCAEGSSCDTSCAGGNCASLR